MRGPLVSMAAILAVLFAATIQSTAQVINGCYSGKNGMLRIVEGVAAMIKVLLKSQFLWMLK